MANGKLEFIQGYSCRNTYNKFRKTNSVFSVMNVITNDKSCFLSGAEAVSPNLFSFSLSFTYKEDM